MIGLPVAGDGEAALTAPRPPGDSVPMATPSEPASRTGVGHPERLGAVAVPADRRLRVPVRLPHRRARRAGRHDRLALRAALRLAERVRRAARPRRGRLPLRARSASTSRRRGSTSPGTNSLVTTWKTPTGWVVVRDALTMGPRRGEDTVTPHTRPPADDDADHVLVRTVAVPRRARSRSSSSASRCSTTAATPASGRWSTIGRHAADASGAGQTIRLHDRHARSASRASRVRARHVLAGGRARVLRAVVGRGPRRARRRRRGRRRGSTPPRAFWRDWLARARDPRPPLARPDPALGAGDQGPDLHADRRDRRGAHHLAARDARAASATGTTATPGCATRPSRCRRCTASTSTGRPTSSCSSSPTSSRNEDGALQIMYGIDGRRDLTESTRDDLSGYAGARPVRIGNGAFDQRQNDVYGAVLDSILLHTRRSQRLPRRLWPIVAGAGRVRDAGLARARPGHLGGARQAAALRLLEADVLGRARPRGRSSPSIRGDAELAGDLARDRRGDPAPTSSSTASTSAACCASTTTPTRSTPRRCWRRSSASCRGDDERLRATVLAIADELTEDGFVLRYRTDETDDGLSGKEGTLPDLLVLAGLGAGDRRRARSAPAT